MSKIWDLFSIELFRILFLSNCTGLFLGVVSAGFLYYIRKLPTPTSTSSKLCEAMDLATLFSFFTYWTGDVLELHFLISCVVS